MDCESPSILILTAGDKVATNDSDSQETHSSIRLSSRVAYVVSNDLAKVNPPHTSTALPALTSIVT